MHFCTPHAHSVCRSQKKVLEPLKPELQMVVSSCKAHMTGLMNLVAEHGRLRYTNTRSKTKTGIR